MCRLLAYRGPARPLEDLVCAPRHSLVRQSLHAGEAKAATNGDGFGLGWYGAHPEPGVYRETRPAWADDNLTALARHVRAGLFMAHVRAATGTAVSRENCHPFAHGRWLFAHNGQVGGWERLRRPVEALLPDALYAARRGSTDSEALFLLTLAGIEAGLGPVEAVGEALRAVRVLAARLGVTAPLRVAATLSDGVTLWAFREASDARPPTLYLRETAAGGTVLASEPLDGARDGWRLLPPGSAVSIGRGGVRVGSLRAGGAAPAAPEVRAAA